MTTESNRLAKSAGGFPGSSAYRASEWAMMARAKGHTKVAKEWDDADRDGWDDKHFSLKRREELADKHPGAFGPHLEFRSVA